jgi:hypothetical protein
LNENACGSGWRTECGNVATQKDLDATRVGREFGPGSELQNFSELGSVFSQFLLFGSFVNFASELGSAFNSETTKPAQRGPFQPVRNFILA